MRSKRTGKKVSRQYLWQLKMKKEGRCLTCAVPTTTGRYCPTHLAKNRIRNRTSIGCSTRTFNGVPIDNVEAYNAERLRAAIAYDSGKSSTELARLFQSTPASILDIVREHGFKIRRTGPTGPTGPRSKES